MSSDESVEQPDEILDANEDAGIDATDTVSTGDEIEALAGDEIEALAGDDAAEVLAGNDAPRAEDGAAEVLAGDEVEALAGDDAPRAEDGAASRSNDADPSAEIGTFDAAAVSADTTRAIEAILMVADEPVTPQLMGELLEISPTQIEFICAHMAQVYEDERRGFVLARVSGGYRFQSHPELAGYVERFVLDGQAARLSQAAMETLAIVAYKQPISRAQVASIRGVNVDGVMRTLVQRNYVAELAIDPGPGGATLFGTTKLFLQNLGLDSLAELPPLGDLVPGAEVMEALEASLRIDGESGRPVRSRGDGNALDAVEPDEQSSSEDPQPEIVREPSEPAQELREEDAMNQRDAMNDGDTPESIA
jgi:segregation and condensation protein B